MDGMKQCPHCGVSRSTFADEGSWLAHLQHEARMARAAHSMAGTRTRAYRWGKPGSRSWRAHYRAQHRNWDKGYRTRHRDKRNARKRELHMLPKNRAHDLASKHGWYERNKDWKHDYNGWWWRMNGDAHNARRRERTANETPEERAARLAHDREYRRGRNPDWGQRAAQEANIREQVLELRRQGLTFLEIGRQLGKSETAVYKVYYRAMKRRQDEQGEQSA